MRWKLHRSAEKKHWNKIAEAEEIGFAQSMAPLLVQQFACKQTVGNPYQFAVGLKAINFSSRHA